MEVVVKGGNTISACFVGRGRDVGGGGGGMGMYFKRDLRTDFELHLGIVLASLSILSAACSIAVNFRLLFGRKREEMESWISFCCRGGGGGEGYMFDNSFEKGMWVRDN